MKPIEIGTKPDGMPLNLDTEIFLSTRLLLTANSGGGKSWLLRRLAELLCRQMPVVIIDPEGEFASLREKFPFVLVGKGGDTPADCRSAGLVMRKILELRASAVIDLYELQRHERHRYIKLFCEAAMEAPKEHWRPTTFIFDEVHEFCPENGKGESEAKNAVLAFPTKGRKRQFGSIFATQRLAKLSKDARAEFQNRMIGQMFEPDDIQTAAGILGLGRAEVADFSQMMRTTPSGNFYAFGRAISLLPNTQVRVGPVETSHETAIQTARHGAQPPPAPEKIRHLLPKLADLPKEAEEKAKTEAQLRDEIRELRKQLKEAPKPAAIVSKEKELVISGATAAKLVKSTDALKILSERMEGQARTVASLYAEVMAGLNKLARQAESRRPITPQTSHHATARHVQSGRAVAVEVLPPSEPRAKPANGQERPTGGALEVLKVCAQYPDGATDEQIAVLTGFKRSSVGTFKSRLACRKLIVNNRANDNLFE